VDQSVAQRYQIILADGKLLYLARMPALINPSPPKSIKETTKLQGADSNYLDGPLGDSDFLGLRVPREVVEASCSSRLNPEGIVYIASPRFLFLLPPCPPSITIVLTQAAVQQHQHNQLDQNQHI